MGNRAGTPLRKTLDRRREILRSAVTTLSNYGFRGATTRRIARDAGVSEALLYKHFRNKEALLDAVLDHLVETFQSAPRARRLAEAPISDRDFLVRFGHQALEQAQRHPEEVRILFYAGLQRHRLAAEYYRSQVKVLREVVVKRIENGQREGTFRPLPADIAANCYLSMLRSQILKLVLFGQLDTSIDEAPWPEQFVDIFIRGIS